MPAQNHFTIPPLAKVIITALLMWLIHDALMLGRFNTSWQTPLSLLLMVIAAGLVMAGGIRFRRAKTSVNPLAPEKTTALVTAGVYQFSRNPMYLGFVVALTGWGVYLGSLLSFAMLPLFIFTMTRFQIRAEEQALDMLFGDTCRVYKQHVRRWI